MELRPKQLNAQEALDVWGGLDHFLPTGAYPVPIDAVRPPEAPGPWNYGAVGSEPEIDLDFETKKGGPWGVWIISRSRDLYVAAHPDAPVDRLLYFISRRNACFLNIPPSWHQMVTAASMAGFTHIGDVSHYGIWTRHGSEYHFYHS